MQLAPCMQLLTPLFRQACIIVLLASGTLHLRGSNAVCDSRGVPAADL